MVADILTVIQSRMSKFSKGQKLIAKYILSAYDKAAFMTASKLGGIVQVCGVHGGAVCRGPGVRRLSGDAEGPAGDDPETS